MALPFRDRRRALAYQGLGIALGVKLGVSGRWLVPLQRVDRGIGRLQGQRPADPDRGLRQRPVPRNAGGRLPRQKVERPTELPDAIRSAMRAVDRRQDRTPQLRIESISSGSLLYLEFILKVWATYAE
jgi:hypothetical protein